MVLLIASVTFSFVIGSSFVSGKVYSFFYTFFIIILVPSQVIVGRTISKKQMLMSVCTKIGIQLNCKLGGEAWAVEIPVSTVMTTVS